MAHCAGRRHCLLLLLFLFSCFLYFPVRFCSFTHCAARRSRRRWCTVLDERRCLLLLCFFLLLCPFFCVFPVFFFQFFPRLFLFVPLFPSAFCFSFVISSLVLFVLHPVLPLFSASCSVCSSRPPPVPLSLFLWPSLASIKPENGLSSRVRASRSWGTNASVSLRRNRGRKFALLCLVRSLSFSVCPGLFFFSSPLGSPFSLSFSLARLPLSRLYKVRDSPGGGNGWPPKCSATDTFNEETYALAANGWNGGRRQWTVVQETAPFSIQPLISIWSLKFWHLCN